MNKRKLISVLLIIFIYAVATGVSFAFFSKISQKTQVGLQSPVKGSNGVAAFDASLPKTEPCPLNGSLYSTKQKEWWEGHRPLGVMIENHENSRPQSGLSFADVVYEAVAEGGITRFLAVYYCQDAPQVGPVRSARTYFLDMISEYGENPLYAHVGGANAPGPADALSQIIEYDWASYNDLNQFSIGFPVFWRDYDRLGHTTDTEHTMYSTTGKLWAFAKTRGLTNVDKDGNPWNEKFVSYTFKEDAEKVERPAKQTIHVEFWNGYKKYFVDWTYDKESNLYKRNNGGEPHIDRDNNKQLASKNIVTLYMKEINANDGYENNIHLLYKTKGSGKGVIFMDGKKVPVVWRKEGRTARTLLFDGNGNPVKFNKGIIWFEILPLDGVVDVK